MEIDFSLFCNRPFGRSIATLWALSHIALKYKVPLYYGRQRTGSHARSVYSTQETLCIGTARVMKEEEKDKNNSVRVIRDMEVLKAGTKEKSFKQDLPSADDLRNYKAPRGTRVLLS